MCLECRRAAEEYETVARVVMPSLAADFPVDPMPIPEGWSEERARHEFFKRLDLQERSNTVRMRFLGWGKESLDNPAASEASNPWWHRLTETMPYAAGIVLAAIIGLLGYQIGQRRSEIPTRVSPQPTAATYLARNEIAAISQERQALHAQLEDRDRAIASLSSKTARQVAEIQELKSKDQAAQDSFQKVQEEKNQTVSEREGFRQKLEQAQTQLASIQTEMDSLRQQRSGEAARVAELEARLGQFPELVKERDATIEQQRELLARDRDIRDLMGARDLYVAEVMDVGRDGETKKPFGRVFYTKGTSLIFYAYDLDQQPSLREASTFQAWGRRGADAAQAMNLGIFYVDNTTHKRWVLKFDDPKSLDQIDAVFVTVEPKGGSRKPSGKQLLFAYLRVEPNHP